MYPSCHPLMPLPTISRSTRQSWKSGSLQTALCCESMDTGQQAHTYILCMEDLRRIFALQEATAVVLHHSHPMSNTTENPQGGEANPQTYGSPADSTDAFLASLGDSALTLKGIADKAKEYQGQPVSQLFGTMPFEKIYSYDPQKPCRTSLGINQTATFGPKGEQPTTVRCEYDCGRFTVEDVPQRKFIMTDSANCTTYEEEVSEDGTISSRFQGQACAVPKPFYFETPQEKTPDATKTREDRPGADTARRSPSRSHYPSRIWRSLRLNRAKS